MEFIELTVIFTCLFGIILVLLFTSGKANTKNLYLKKAR